MDFLLQVKGTTQMLEIPFSTDGDSNKAGLDALFAECRAHGYVLGLGIMQVVYADSKQSVMGAYFNHFGDDCIEFITKQEYFARMIINTGCVVVGTALPNSIPLDMYTDLQVILSRCNSHGLVLYNQSKYKMSLYKALVSIGEYGEISSSVNTLTAFSN